MCDHDERRHRRCQIHPIPAARSSSLRDGARRLRRLPRRRRRASPRPRRRRRDGVRAASTLRRPERRRDRVVRRARPRRPRRPPLRRDRPSRRVHEHRLERVHGRSARVRVGGARLRQAERRHRAAGVPRGVSVSLRRAATRHGRRRGRATRADDLRGGLRRASGRGDGGHRQSARRPAVGVIAAVRLEANTLRVRAADVQRWRLLARRVGRDLARAVQTLRRRRRRVVRRGVGEDERAVVPAAVPRPARRPRARLDRVRCRRGVRRRASRRRVAVPVDVPARVRRSPRSSWVGSLLTSGR